MKDKVVSSKRKHIMVKYYFVHEMIEKNETTVDYMTTVDPLTKEISKHLFLKYVIHMELKYL